MSVNPRTQYTYDAFGRRVTKTHASTGSATYTHHYLYDNQNIMAILNEDKEILASIVHHPSRTDTPLSITNHQTGKTYYYHRDHQGSIIALTNEYGEVAESIIYDGDFGEEFIHLRQETTFNPYGYTGREYDMDDLYYYRARYYDPTTQRFLSMDPIEFEAGDVNFYRYVGNDCVNFVDPSGLLQYDPITEVPMEIMQPLYEAIEDGYNWVKKKLNPDNWKWYQTAKRDIKACNNQMSNIGKGISDTASKINKGLPPLAKAGLAPAGAILAGPAIVPVAQASSRWAMMNPIKATTGSAIMGDIISDATPAVTPFGQAAYMYQHQDDLKKSLKELRQFCIDKCKKESSE